MSSEYSNQIHEPEVDMSNDEYLDKKIRCLVEPLITSLLVERPKEPVILFYSYFAFKFNFSLLNFFEKFIGNFYDRLVKKLFRKNRRK
jgi:hypothetical protein